MQYLETCHYSNGEVYATLHDSDGEISTPPASCDRYIDEIGTGGSYDTLEAWAEQPAIDPDMADGLVAELRCCGAVNLTVYM